MKITSSWLKDHLDTNLNENQIIDKLTDIGLEVEGVDSQSSDLDSFLVAKILKSVYKLKHAYWYVLRVKVSKIR